MRASALVENKVLNHRKVFPSPTLKWRNLREWVHYDEYPCWMTYFCVIARKSGEDNKDIIMSLNEWNGLKPAYEGMVSSDIASFWPIEISTDLLKPLRFQVALRRRTNPVPNLISSAEGLERLRLRKSHVTPLTMSAPKNDVSAPPIPPSFF